MPYASALLSWDAFLIQLCAMMKFKGAVLVEGPHVAVLVHSAREDPTSTDAHGVKKPPDDSNSSLHAFN